MSRDLSASNLAAVQATVVRLALFAEFEFPSATSRVWSGRGNKTAFGNTFSGVGTLGGVSEIQETDGTNARNLVFTLSGIPTALIATALTEKMRGHICRLWVGFFDADLSTLVDDPHQIYAGRMDVPRITEVADVGMRESVISLNTENILNDLGRPAVRRWSDAEHQLAHPGDTFFSRTAKVVEEQILWPRP